VLSEQVFTQLWTGYIHGTPNKIHSINDKHTYGNAKNLNRYLKVVEKSFAKEDAQDISLMLPSFLVSFAPNTWLIPLGVAVIDNKKPRMYCSSATMRIDKDLYPVNWIVDKTTKPDIIFGST
jgi:hypothetical protein